MSETRRKSVVPPRTDWRTWTGLTLLFLSIGWATPHIGNHLPGFDTKKLFYAISGDVLLLSSLFVLGGDFWDKLRSLLRHDARAVISDRPPVRGSSERC